MKYIMIILNLATCGFLFWRVVIYASQTDLKTDQIKQNINHPQQRMHLTTSPRSLLEFRSSPEAIKKIAENAPKIHKNPF